MVNGAIYSMFKFLYIVPTLSMGTDYWTLERPIEKVWRWSAYLGWVSLSENKNQTDLSRLVIEIKRIRIIFFLYRK